MSRKHMKESEDSFYEKLLDNKNFKIDILNSQLAHKDNEVKDFKKEVLDILKRIINVGEANSYNNSKIAIKVMKEIAKENYRKIAIDLYNLDLSKDKMIELHNNRQVD